MLPLVLGDSLGFGWVYVAKLLLEWVGGSQGLTSFVSGKVKMFNSLRGGAVLEILLVIAAIISCLTMQALDDLLSRFGVVSVLHGGLLGFGQVWVAKQLLEWGGASLGWFVVLLVALAAMAVSAYRIHSTGTRWVFAFNFGVFVVILYGGFHFV